MFLIFLHLTFLSFFGSLHLFFLYFPEQSLHASSGVTPSILEYWLHQVLNALKSLKVSGAFGIVSMSAHLPSFFSVNTAHFSSALQSSMSSMSAHGTSHGSSLQACFSESAGHFSPPFIAGFVTVRVRVCSPPSHSLEHSPHALKAETWQSPSFFM